MAQPINRIGVGRPSSALTEPTGPEATKVVNGLLIGSASEAGTADLD
jgi:hypothetical protein